MAVAVKLQAEPVARPIKGAWATYALATEGAKTERGGEVVHASTGMVIEGHRIACVGDVVRYPDGSESKIVSGAGFAAACKRQPTAIVGSATDNGDTIISSLQSHAKIRGCADGSIPGFLQTGYVCPGTTPEQAA
jgi:uncharacterized Zn-binding protein involved in type VI secretion